MGGAMVEAAYVERDPPLLSRLADLRLPWAIDSQSVRFAGPGYLQTASVANLPYAPKSPLDSSRFTPRVQDMVQGALEFQAAANPTAYLVPSLPVRRASPGSLRAMQELHEFAADMNGRSIPYKPMLASLFVGTNVMRGRFGVADRLIDRAWAGAYVVPLQFHPRRDGLERLVAYFRFLEDAQSLGLPVTAGRAGTLGLILAAFGVSSFDCGLGEGDSFNLTGLDRLRNMDHSKTDGEESKSGGRRRWVYIHALLSQVTDKDAMSMLAVPALRAQLTCVTGSCRFRGYLHATNQPREHSLHSRAEELQLLASRSSVESRVQLVDSWLRSAADLGRMVNRVRFEQREQPVNFGHLDIWRGVLARLATAYQAPTK